MYRGLSAAEVLEAWKRSNKQEVAALHAIGRATGGLRISPPQRVGKFREQRSLHWDDRFQSLLRRVSEQMPTYNSKLRVQSLHGLSMCHEDLAVYRDAYQHTDFIVDLCTALVGDTDDLFLDSRDGCLTLFYLSRMSILLEAPFKNADKMVRTGNSIDVCQALFACARLNFPVNVDAAAAAADQTNLSDLATMQTTWALAQLGVELPPRLVSRLNKISDISTFGYGLYTAALATDALSPALFAKAEVLARNYQQHHPSMSILQKQVGEELAQHFDVEAEPEVPYFVLYPDFRINYQGKSIYVEVQGPGHYLVSPGRTSPLGRTALKSRIFQRLNLTLLEVPYYAVCVDKQFSKELFWKWMEDAWPKISA